MQIEITITAPDDADYAASDLGFLLHKHPDHLHTRDTSAGEVTVFYPEKPQEWTCRAFVPPLVLV